MLKPRFALRKLPFHETIPGDLTESEWHPSRGEQHRAMHDMVKHMSTLSSGSLVLVITLMDKVFQKPVAGAWLICAVVCLFLSLVASAFGYFMLVVSYPRVGGARMDKASRNGMATWLGILLATFVVGMFLLATFFVMNLLSRS